MSNDADMSVAASPSPRTLNRRRLRGVLVLGMGCLALAAPFFAGPLTFLLGGALLIICGFLELLESFSTPDSQVRAVYLSGEMSIVAGIVLVSLPEFILNVASVVLAGLFLIDAVGRGIAAVRARLAGTAWAWLLATSLLNLALALMLATRWPLDDWSLVAFVIGLRMLGTGWALLTRPQAPPEDVATPADEHADIRLKLPAHPAFATLNAALDAEEERSRPTDIYWCLIFLLVFFAIHVGRMRVYWTLVGIIGPLAAVVGDLAVTLVLAFCIVLPLRLAWRTLTRPLERRAWPDTLAALESESAPGLAGQLRRAWLVGRLRFARRLRRMRRSPLAALRWALPVGLPFTAVFIAIQPLFGFSYFFNSEAWASIVWQRWAMFRTDPWREGMIAALRDHYADLADDQLFRLEPPGVGGNEDFSFLVIADNGEGNEAQHSLRDRYILLGQRPDVKFLMICSDVIYPEGAMRDYEPNFYLPFKGFTKPIYALPGNHDWYDALEGFNANFLVPEAARTCMVSRLKTDFRLTSTTEGRIDGYIDEAARLRREYGLSVGHQRGPFFEIQTDRFALIAVDTGVLRTVDSRQWTWLEQALKRSRGKFIMVKLGHPLFMGGNYQGDEEKLGGEWSGALRSPLGEGEAAPFTAIHRLLREHQVDVVMAGDMHHFEYYQEPWTTAAGQPKTMRHFVNGGGGAYITVGVPFDWPAQPDASPWAYYPRKDAVIDKLDAQTPFWKMPLWLWVKHWSAWPFNGYIMSAAFNHNSAPYFQSFMEVQVNNSKDEVRFLVHCANGRLRWRDLENFEALLPEGQTGDDFVEFVAKMPPR